MSEYRSDEEQVEALKNWWDENGTSLVLTVAVSLAIVFGFRTWQADVREKGEIASGQYQDLVETLLVPPGQPVEDSSLQTSKYLADSLKNTHGDSVYARFAALAMAKEAVEAGDLERAESELRWVVTEGPNDSITLVAKMRLARVLASREKYEDALAMLAVEEPGEHRSSIEEVRGDVYHAMGRTEEARKAYTDALAALGDKGAKPMLQMKLDDLSAPGKTAAAAPPVADPEAGSAQED